MTAFRVVHVDDDPDILELSRRRFRRRFSPEATLYTCADPDDAFAYLLDHDDVDCLVSDSVSLGSGELLVAAVHQRLPALPTILLTAKDWADVPAEAHSDSLVEHVLKGSPDDFIRVFDHVARLVDAADTADAATPTAETPTADPVSPSDSVSPAAWQSLDYHDWGADTPDEFADALVDTIASLAGVDPDALPVLFDSLDVDALAALFDASGSVSVSFEYAGYDVLVTNDGLVAIK